MVQTEELTGQAPLFDEDEMAARVLPQTTGDRIVLAMRHLGIDARELAHRTGIPKSTLSRYINDESPVPEKRLGVVADALGVTPDYLLGYRPTRAWSDLVAA